MKSHRFIALLLCAVMTATMLRHAATRQRLLLIRRRQRRY